MRKISPEESDFIIELYREGSSTLKIGSLLDRRPSTIRNHLVRKDIPMRSSNERKYSLNDSYFDDLCNEGSAYWLGALTADGHIFGNRVTLDAKSDDMCWLEQFKEAIGYTGRIYKFPSCENRFSTKPRSSLSFTSHHMQHRLMEYGFTFDKTHSAHFCEKVPVNMLRHYIRGLIDGDGSICEVKKSNTFMISFVGTEELVPGVVVHLNVVLNLDIKVRPHKMIYCFSVGGVDNPKSIIKYLYSNSNYYLKRKKNMAEKCLQRMAKKG